MNHWETQTFWLKTKFEMFDNYIMNRHIENGKMDKSYLAPVYIIPLWWERTEISPIMLILLRVL